MARYERSRGGQRESWIVERRSATLWTWDGAGEDGGPIGKLTEPSVADACATLAKLVAEKAQAGFVLVDPVATLGEQGPLPPPDVVDLHARLVERLDEVRPLVVRDVLRVFVDVASLPCRRRLWSFEFCFDEDEGRTARLEARFVAHGMSGIPGDEDLDGFNVDVRLPHLIPARPFDELALAAADKEAGAVNLVTRFNRALADLGAYQVIEPLEARGVDVYRV